MQKLHKEERKAHRQLVGLGLSLVLALSPMGVMAAETDAATEDAVVVQEESAAGQSAAAQEEAVLQEEPAAEESSTAESEDFASASVRTGKCGKNVTWKLANGVLTISGRGAMADYDQLVGLSPFMEMGNITKVVIGSGVTSIGTGAFEYCEKVRSVTIPDSVTRIGQEAFGGCESLVSVTIPKGVTKIENYVFLGCSSLSSVTIRGAVTSIGDMAFSGCSSLKSLTIPSSVKSLGEEAFAQCSSLTNVTIPSSVTSIGNMAFSECGALKSVTIPSSVTSIGESMFSGCSSLTSVTIPPSVKSIGEFAFDSCSSLKNVYYTGSESAWKKIRIGEYNDELLDATIHYGRVGSFVDVPASVYYAPAVSWASAKGITSGISKTQFGPNNTCTRAQIVTFLYKAAGSPKVSGSLSFTDVKKGSYYYNAVLWAKQKGITAGKSAKLFGTNDPCTRAQIVTFLWKWKGSSKVSTGSSFRDVPKKAYYTTAVSWAVQNKITAGKTKTAFGPNDPCTRAQAVAFLYRAK